MLSILSSLNAALDCAKALAPSKSSLPLAVYSQIVMPIATKKNHISITISKPSTKRYTTKDYKDMGFFNHIVHENEKQRTPRYKELLHFSHNL